MLIKLLSLLLVQLYLTNATDKSNIFQVDKPVPKLGPVVNNQKRDINSSFQVFCGVQQGAQPLFFEWFKNGQPIKAGPGLKWQIETFKKVFHPGHCPDRQGRRRQL